MKTWYLKLDSEGMIMDAIDYAYEGYTEVQLADTSLPSGINGGWFKWDGTSYVEDLTKKPIDEASEISSLKIRTKATEDAVVALMDMSMM